uniref:Secreted protein n=1 Tax=Ascaris lumbricoides TaxID=6252 RepID=A0A0M3HKF3_ASCLU
MPLNNLTSLISLLLLCVPSATDQGFTEFDTLDGFPAKPIIEVTHVDDLVTNNIRGNGITPQTVPNDRRVDCLPDGATISLCATRNCILDMQAPVLLPF